MSVGLIAIEGIDQAGKKTQTRMLASRLRHQGYKTGTVSFPVYNSDSGKSIQSYLEGNRHYTFQALCMLYSLNRWEHVSLLNRLMRNSNFLIANRYTPAGLAYGVAGGLDSKWLENLDKGLPLPDEVIVLDVPIGASFGRKTMGRDAHERDAHYLRKVRRAYLELAGKCGWKIVEGTGSIETVHQRVWKSVSRSIH